MELNEFDRMLAIKRKTRADVAKTLGISESTLSRRIAGSRGWKLEEFFKIVDLLGISVAEAKKIFR